jgi:D-alanine transaminase/branched-chain amino acid aminotransferase
MYPYCFFNGKIVRSNKPLIHLNDIAILRGYAAFDFMRIYNGQPFQFKTHMVRFKNTAKLMGLKNSFSDEQIEIALNQLISKNKDKSYQVRFILTGGETVNGLFPSVPVFYILFEKISDLADSMYIKGAKIITHNHKRLLAEAKNSNYMQAVLLQQKRLKQKAVEILYTWNDVVFEATTSNIFIVKDKVLYTPKDSILKGITRKKVLEIARAQKIKVVEKEISVEELHTADEVFLTATNKKVLPIVQIDLKKVKDGKVGEVTKKLMSGYNSLLYKI